MKSLLTKSLMLLFLVGTMSFGIAPNSKELTSKSSADFGGAYLTFADKFGGEVTADDISKTLTLGVAGCAAGSKINQFTLYIPVNGKTQIFKGASNTLNKEMISALKKLKPTQEFYFKRVKAQLPKGGIVDVYCKNFVVV